MVNFKLRFLFALVFFGLAALTPHLNALPPIVKNIVPRSGPHIGGTRILIEGYNFDKKSIVKIGDKQCPFTRLYKTKKSAIIYTVVPEGPPILSSAYVTVTNSRGETSLLNKKCVYTYVPPMRFENTPYIPPVELNIVR